MFQWSFSWSEYSTTESDEFEKQDGGDLTCEEERTFFDAADYFTESNIRSSTMSSSTDCGVHSANNIDNSGGHEIVDIQIQDSDNMLTQIKRRSKLPEPTEKEKGISLWSIIKDSVGKDLTRVCLPVYFNEPLSSLQKCFEDLEYSYLLDQAYEYGKVVKIISMFLFCISRIFTVYDESFQISKNSYQLLLLFVITSVFNLYANILMFLSKRLKQ